MHHDLIIGATGTGKSTFARAYVGAIVKRHPIKLAVCDFTRGDWGADFQTPDPDHFIRWLMQPKRERWRVVVDESGLAVDKSNFLFTFLTTTGRHCGYLSTFVAQTYVQLAKTMRRNARNRFVFANDDGPEIAREWKRPELAAANDLPPFHFIHSPPFGPCRRGKLTHGGRKIEWTD